MVEVHGPRITLHVLHDQGRQHHERHDTKRRHTFWNGMAHPWRQRLQHADQKHREQHAPRECVVEELFFGPLTRGIRCKPQKRLVRSKPHERNHGPHHIHGVRVGPILAFRGAPSDKDHRRKPQHLGDHIGRHHPMAVPLEKGLDVRQGCHASNQVWEASSKVNTEALFITLMDSKSRSTWGPRFGKCRRVDRWVANDSV